MRLNPFKNIPLRHVSATAPVPGWLPHAASYRPRPQNREDGPIVLEERTSGRIDVIAAMSARPSAPVRQLVERALDAASPTGVTVAIPNLPDVV